MKTMVTETQKAHRTRQGPGCLGSAGHGEVQSYSPAHHCPAHRNESCLAHSRCSQRCFN